MSEAIVSPEQQSEVVRLPLVAFGRFVKPETHDVFGQYDVSSVMSSEREWMNAPQLGAVVFAEKPHYGLGIVNGVRVNTEEYALVARHPEWIANTVMSRVIGARAVDDARIEKAQRIAAESLEAKRERMASHVDELTVIRASILELKREARTPGFAHKTEERMDQLFGVALGEFQNILNVAHLQRDWDDDRRERAHTALLDHLTVGPQRQRVAHWTAMLGLADSYLGARTSLFRNRIRSTGRFLTSTALAA